VGRRMHSSFGAYNRNGTACRSQWICGWIEVPTGEQADDLADNWMDGWIGGLNGWMGGLDGWMSGVDLLAIEKWPNRKLLNVCAICRRISCD